MGSGELEAVVALDRRLAVVAAGIVLVALGKAADTPPQDFQFSGAKQGFIWDVGTTLVGNLVCDSITN